MHPKPEPIAARLTVARALFSGYLLSTPPLSEESFGKLPRIESHLLSVRSRNKHIHTRSIT